MTLSPTRDDAMVLEKLTNFMGTDRAQSLFHEILSEISLECLTSPDDRLRFGQALVKRPGGVEHALGRAINIQAILQGAER